jgi:putative PIN family toxin of toxin-antitoxin system
MKPRVVLDTQVWLDWLHFDDPRCATLEMAWRQAALEIIVDPPCRDEWCRVLTYPIFALDVSAQARCLTAFDTRCRMVDAAGEDMPVLPRCKDPDDQKFIELAVRTGASAILSRDHALLALDRRLRRDYGLAVIAPPQLPALS